MRYEMIVIWIVYRIIWTWRLSCDDHLSWSILVYILVSYYIHWARGLITPLQWFLFRYPYELESTAESRCEKRSLWLHEDVCTHCIFCHTLSYVIWVWRRFSFHFIYLWVDVCTYIFCYVYKMGMCFVYTSWESLSIPWFHYVNCMFRWWVCKVHLTLRRSYSYLWGGVWHSHSQIIELNTNYWFTVIDLTNSSDGRGYPLQIVLISNYPKRKIIRPIPSTRKRLCQKKTTPCSWMQ